MTSGGAAVELAGVGTSVPVAVGGEGGRMAAGGGVVGGVGTSVAAAVAAGGGGGTAFVPAGMAAAGKGGAVEAVAVSAGMGSGKMGRHPAAVNDDDWQGWAAVLCAQPCRTRPKPTTRPTTMSAPTRKKKILVAFPT